jgi:hypothetical protein
MDANRVKAMSRPSWLQKIYWTRFAKPIEERQLFIELIRCPIQSILEVGVGNGQRMQRIAKLLHLSGGTSGVRYVGTDEFESARDSRGHLSLKQAHQLASHLGYKASLIPGDPSSAIPRVAHKLGASDLLIIDGGMDPAQPTAGFIGNWMNRLAHHGSIVLACAEPGQVLQRVDAKQFDLPDRVAA